MRYLGLSAILSAFRTRGQVQLAKANLTSSTPSEIDKITESSAEGGNIALSLEQGAVCKPAQSKGIMCNGLCALIAKLA